MLSTIIVLVKTVTRAEEKTASALITKKESLFAYSVRIAVKPFTDRTVLPLTKQSCVSDSKSVPSAVKRTSFQRKRNVCGEYRCPNCKSKVLPNHQCYIQPLEMDFSNLLDQADEMNEEDRAILEDMAEAAEKSEQEEDKEPPPLVCCIDFECAVDENKDFEDVRVDWQYVEGSYREAGKAMDMLSDVMSKTVTAELKERKVFVFAHNM